MTLRISTQELKQVIDTIVLSSERRLKAIVENVKNPEHEHYQQIAIARTALLTERHASIARLQGINSLCLASREFHRQYLQDIKDAQETCRNNWKLQDFALAHMQKDFFCLTDRENEVLILLIKSHTNREIALLLGISRRTVDVHRAHIMQKTGASDFAELMTIAMHFVTPSALAANANDQSLNNLSINKEAA